MVRWVLAQRLIGHSIARVARALNEAAIACTSVAEPAEVLNGPLDTVTVILANPWYMGRQVWSRHLLCKAAHRPTQGRAAMQSAARLVISADPRLQGESSAATSPST